MDIQADLNWIHQEIDKVKDPSFIEKLKVLLQPNKDKLIISDENYDFEIEKALENIKNGSFYSEIEAKEISKKWGRK